MEPIEFTNRKHQTIVGDLHIPTGPVAGTVVLEPGWRGDRYTNVVQVMTHTFLDHGMQVLVFDATNSMGHSDGDFLHNTQGTHYEDLEDVVMYARKQLWFRGPLLVSGYSRGGYAAVRFAQSHPTRTDYVVALAPVVSGQLSAKTFQKNDPEGYKQWLKNQPPAPTSGQSGLRKLWSNIRRRVNHDLRPQAHQVRVPILLLAGDQDDRCPPKHIKKLHTKIGSTQKKLAIIANANHDFDNPQNRTDIAQKLSQWLEQTVVH